MFLGAVAAIGQTDIKRLMAYSSISHMGFALMGLAAGTEFGVQALLIYAAIYVVMNIGTFAFILSMEKDGEPVSEIASLNMYSAIAPGRALALMVLLFSLAGVPPLVGFFGKLYVIRAAVQADMVWLAVAGVIASVIAAFYYLRIVYLMYFGAPREGLDGGMAPAQWSALSASALAMVLGVSTCSGSRGWPRRLRRPWPGRDAVSKRSHPAAALPAGSRGRRPATARPARRKVLRKTMRGAAPVTGWPPGLGRIVLDETDSTMAEAARRVATLDGPAWILARRQTAGRGRAGRPWTDPPGNFAATLVLFPDDPPARLALRSFTAVARGCRRRWRH
jgi:hypothetical protein